MVGRLSDFDRGVRTAELDALLGAEKFEAAEVEAVNTHFHTFYSFNIEGISPQEVLYRSKKAGLEVAGIVDFDVLDAMDEVFEAGDKLELRTMVSLETRAFVEDYKDREINSPGECGVLYSMGVGFTRMPEAGTEAHEILQGMRRGASERNIAMLGRLKDALAPMVIDYKEDIESLTPAGNATERHIVEALEKKSRAVFSDSELAGYWSERLGLTLEEAEMLLGDSNALRNTIRAKLMKRGSIGYVTPDSSTFPPLTTVIKMAEELGALPCWAWLDGFSTGEQDAEELVSYMESVGIRAIAIIPERNWNFADPELQRRKLTALRDLVEAGRKRNMVFVIGTEMNSFGQPFIDDFAAPELAPYVGDFLAGAYAAYGHTLLERASGKGMMSSWAKEKFGDDYAAANEFYAELGKAGANPKSSLEALQGCSDFSDLKGIIGCCK